jgi:hypothetical protein
VLRSETGSIAITGRHAVRVLLSPPRSPGLVRFPAVSGKAPGFPRHSRGEERGFQSLLRVAVACGGKMPLGLCLAHTLSGQISSPTDRDSLACQLRPVRIHSGRPSECTSPSDGQKIERQRSPPAWGRRGGINRPGTLVIWNSKETAIAPLRRQGLENWPSSAPNSMRPFAAAENELPDFFGSSWITWSMRTTRGNRALKYAANTGKSTRSFRVNGFHGFAIGNGSRGRGATNA